MKFLKTLFYAAAGALMVLFYREGMEVAMNWVFVIWLPFAAHALAMTITPYQDTKKATGSGTADDQQK
ncbi:hypothetical protein AALA17_04190 [Lactobacillaceae bacterium 24-114]